jgi:hypothetical protein
MSIYHIPVSSCWAFKIETVNGVVHFLLTCKIFCLLFVQALCLLGAPMPAPELVQLSMKSLALYVYKTGA